MCAHFVRPLLRNPPDNHLYHSFTSIYLFQIDDVKKAHVRGLLNAFKVPSQSIRRTQQQAAEQASKFLLSFHKHRTQ